MKSIRPLLVVLSIHLIMGSISLFFWLASLNSLSSSGTGLLSLTLAVVNTLGYLLVSMLFLKKRQPKEVLISVLFFLGIGLFIWLIFLTTGNLGNLFFLYHISGYNSFMWYMYFFGPGNERQLVKIGLLYSVVPSLFILSGFYVSKRIKAKETLRRTALYMGIIIFSIISVFLSSFNGGLVKNQEELANAFPMKTGFPLHFAELRYPTIDPPLPYVYGGFECCSLFVFSWTGFWLSVTSVSLFFLLILEVILFVYRKSAFAKDGN